MARDLVPYFALIQTSDMVLYKTVLSRDIQSLTQIRSVYVNQKPSLWTRIPDSLCEDWILVQAHTVLRPGKFNKNADQDKTSGSQDQSLNILTKCLSVQITDV